MWKHTQDSHLMVVLATSAASLCQPCAGAAPVARSSAACTAIIRCASCDTILPAFKLAPVHLHALRTDAITICFASGSCPGRRRRAVEEEVHQRRAAAVAVPLCRPDQAGRAAWRPGRPGCVRAAVDGLGSSSASVVNPDKLCACAHPLPVLLAYHCRVLAGPALAKTQMRDAQEPADRRQHHDTPAQAAVSPAGAVSQSWTLPCAQEARRPGGPA